MKVLVHATYLFVIISFSGCALIDAILGQRVQKPVLTVESVEFGSISFESIELLFNIGVENPNRLGISLSSFDYELFVNDKQFLQGEQHEGMQIGANATTLIQIPTVLRFGDVIESMRSLTQQDTSSYRFSAGFVFSLPLLGEIRMPLQRSGVIPVIRTPSISVDQLRIDRISLTGADATLALKVRNPNSFSLSLQSLQYNFSIDGVSVLHGKGEKDITITQNEERRVELPVSINFVDFGQSIYRILRGEQKARFGLDGSAIFGSSPDFFKDIPLNFNITGELPLVR